MMEQVHSLSAINNENDSPFVAIPLNGSPVGLPDGLEGSGARADESSDSVPSRGPEAAVPTASGPYSPDLDEHEHEHDDGSEASRMNQPQEPIETQMQQGESSRNPAAQRPRGPVLDKDLFNAAVNGNLDPIRNFIQSNDGNTALLPKTLEGQSILHIHVSAPFDKRPAKLPFIDYLLSLENSALLSITDIHNETAIHKAATFGQHQAVSMFVNGRSSRDLLLIQNNQRDTALHIALRMNKHHQVVNDLCLHSSLKDYSINNDGESILFLAADSGNSTLLDTILAGMGEPIIEDSHTHCELALHAAVQSRNRGMVRSILSVYPYLIKMEDGKSNTPIHYAAVWTDSDILELLLTQSNSLEAANIQDETGRTAAHLAVQNNNLPALKLLVEHVPSSCLIADYQKRNIVHYAAFLGCGEALVYLLTDTRFSPLVNSKDKQGNTPLHLLAYSFKDVQLDSLKRVQDKLFPKLKGLQLKIFNEQGYTPGDIAHSYKSVELERDSQKLVEKFKEMTTSDGVVMQKQFLQTVEEQIQTSQREKTESNKNMKMIATTHSIITTLIMTISFAAGISVPGGFNQDVNDENGGTAMLRNRSEFKVFLISDTIALTSSIISLLICFLITFRKGSRSLKALFVWAFLATSIALVALMVAFMAGTCSIVRQSSSLVFLIILISSVFVVTYALFVMTSLAVLKARSSLMGRDIVRFKGRNRRHNLD